MQVLLAGERKLPEIETRIAGVNNAVLTLPRTVYFKRTALSTWLQLLSGMLLLIMSLSLFIPLDTLKVGNYVVLTDLEALAWAIAGFYGGWSLIGYWGENVNFTLFDSNYWNWIIFGIFSVPVGYRWYRIRYSLARKMELK